MDRRRLLSFLDEHSKDQIWNKVVPHGIVKDLYKRFKETDEWKKLGIRVFRKNYNSIFLLDYFLYKFFIDIKHISFNNDKNCYNC